MKQALLVLALAPFCAQAQIRGTVLNDLLNKSNVSVLDAAAAMIIADAVGLDPMAIIREVRPYGVPVYTTCSGWWISHEYHRPFPDIYKMKQSGKGWGVIAHELGMHPGTFNKLRKEGAFDRYCWVDMTRNHGLTENDWSRFSGRGLDNRDVVIATVLGNGDRNTINTVVSNRLKSGSWNVPGHGKVKAKEAWSHGKSSSSGSSGKSGDHGQGKGKSNGGGGQGQGHGKSNGGGGNGQGQGHGKSNGGGGSDKGHGNGNGGGHGKSNGGGGGPSNGHGNGNGHGHGG